MLMKEIFIYTDFVTLGQFLKLANLIQTGGEAKEFLANHKIFVDGELDNRRGRKLYDGMIVALLDEKFVIKKV